VKQLIPHFIHDASQKGIRQGEFIAFTMFVDLSGFTSLTESLMAKGTRGAEQLSFTLNEIFGPLVKLVYARGGFIPYFAGDAFVVLFPEGKNHVTPNEFVRTAAAMRDLFQQREYRFGNFTIGIKIGLSHGKVSWGIVGDQHKAFYFRGASIESCSQIQNKAKHQDILFDQLFKDRWDGHGFSYEQPSEHCYRLCGEMPPLEAVDLPVLSPPQPEIVAQFLPPAVMDYEAEGEFRTIVTIFISFSGLETHEELNHFATLVLDQIQGSDKGGVIVAFFGAPISFENNVNRALEFMDAVQVELREKLAYTDARIRAGITSGMAFTGIVGGRERCQYAAVGNRVNLAARLMTFASWNEVMVDDEICKNRHFAFQHAGNIKYKGIKGPVPTYKLTGRQYNLQSAHFGRMVGRKREIEQLTRFAQPLFSGRPAGVAFVYGEAGIGKSRLMHELRMLLLSQGKLGWHVCQVDQILRKPFNPFIFFLLSLIHI
jgi:class 3 adenylate cyclase